MPSTRKYFAKKYGVPDSQEVDSDDIPSVTFESSTYLLVQRRTYWPGALKYCNQRDLDLVALNSKRENEFVTSLIEDIPEVPKGISFYVIRMHVLSAGQDVHKNV